MELPVDFWVLVIGQVLTLFTSLLALYVANMIRLTNTALRHEINSRFTEMLILNKEAAHAKGHREGTEEERTRSRELPKYEGDDS